jgi:hypothetical protein
MARELDPVVPPPLAKALEADPSDSVGFTVLLITTGESGRPRLGMLSLGELALAGADRLTVAIWPQSTATANITRSRRATLACVLEATSYTVHTDAARLADVTTPASGTLACFSLTVVGATADRAPYAELESGVRFRLKDPPNAIARWRAVRAALERVTPDETAR